MKKNYKLQGYLEYFFTRFLPFQRGLSQNTIETYKQSWKLFLEYLIESELSTPDKSLRLGDIHADHILSFLEHLEQTKAGRSNKIATRNNRLAAIKSFYYSVKLINPKHNELCDQILLIPTKKSPKPIMDYMEKYELETLFFLIDTSRTKGLRDMTILRLLYNTGARVSEIAHIRLSDLDLNCEKQIRIAGKGGRLRICPLWDSTLSFISIYLKSERKTPQKGYEKYLFINQRGTPFTRFGLWRMITNYFKKSQKKMPSMAKKRITAHTFRHTTAVHMLQCNARRYLFTLKQL